MKHKLRRILSLAAALTVGGCALGMFAGCTTKHPEVLITYSFDGKNYTVKYILSRNDAPQTVQHFIELADAGYYDGMCVHDYTSDAIYSGGYYLKDDELEEVDYFETVKRLETERGITFTQSVWKANEAKEPLYTVYGEFYNNGVSNARARENVHSAGALVMYYTDKGDFNGDVVVERADKGKNNDGQSTQYARYATNSATSLFYTYTGSANMTWDSKYSVFGIADDDDYQKQMVDGLLAAISAYQDTLGENEDFTTEKVTVINEYEPFEEVAKARDEKTFHTPVKKPIIIQSVKVKKY